MLKRTLVTLTKMVGTAEYSAVKRSVPVVHPCDAAYGEITWIASGESLPEGYEYVTINVSHAGTKYGLGGGRWAVCSICQEEFLQSELTKSGGKWYCTKNRCVEDLA
jgi:hypothetical protein